MKEMRVSTTNRRVSAGDTVEVGSEILSVKVDVNRGNRFVYCVSKGEPSEYVYLEERFGDGEEIEIPDSSTVIDVSDGNGMSNPVCRYLTPLDEYGGDAE